MSEQATIPPEQDDLMELARTMQMVLLAMQEGTIQCSVAYRALCRRAYEPFRSLTNDDGMDHMSISQALQICREAQL